jgi:hypothetical protein
MFSFFEVPKDVLKKLRLLDLNFFLQNEGQKKKYHLTKLDVLCTPEDQGGIDILNLKHQNECLLSNGSLDCLTLKTHGKLFSGGSI